MLAMLLIQVQKIFKKNKLQKAAADSWGLTLAMACLMVITVCVKLSTLNFLKHYIIIKLYDGSTYALWGFRGS